MKLQQKIKSWIKPILVLVIFLMTAGAFSSVQALDNPWMDGFVTEQGEADKEVNTDEEDDADEEDNADKEDKQQNKDDASDEDFGEAQATKNAKFFMQFSFYAVGVVLFIGGIALLGVGIFDISTDGNFNVISTITLHRYSYFSDNKWAMLGKLAIAPSLGVFFLNGTVQNVMIKFLLWILRIFR